LVAEYSLHTGADSSSMNAYSWSWGLLQIFACGISGVTITKKCMLNAGRSLIPRTLLLW